MPYQNRVTPYSALIATLERGGLMGNRGCLHDERGAIRRAFVGQRWIACLLDFRGRKRAVMTPGRYTELFFLDEATSLAAGHRPCAECRREDYNCFRRAWVAAGLSSQGALPSAGEIDTHLHAERLDPTGDKTTHPARLADLPDGVFVVAADNNQPLLFRNGLLWPWTPGGYTRAVAPAKDAAIRLLTPPALVAALAAGYAPGYHPSVSRQ